MDMEADEKPQGRNAGGNAADPSMRDILASIRRILSEDEVAAPVSSTIPPRMTAAVEPAPKDDILDLDAGLMVDATIAQPPELAGPLTQTPPSEATPGMIAPEAARAATSSMTQLMHEIARDRMAGVSRNGPTLEDLVRDELRPMLKEWLDNHLPPMVERLVRSELERLSARVGI